jgi:hypothetical protein
MGVTLSSVPPDDRDPLDEVDRILNDYACALRELAERTTQLQAEQRAFLEDFAALCENEVCPVMEEVVTRLRKNGGGGFVHFQPDGGTASTTPRLTLWMSLDGEINGSPRQDRHPYFQLDADRVRRRVKVSAGDMWEGRGSHHSGPLGLWELTALTAEAVIEEILTILRRAASQPSWDAKNS